MNLILDIRHYLIPETIIFILIFLNIILSITFNQKQQKSLFFINLLGICGAITSFRAITSLNPAEILNGAILSDSISIISRLAIAIGCLFTILLSKNIIERLDKNTGEYFAILLTATVGAMLLVSSNDLVMLITSLETLGISSYILSAYLKKDKLSNEAGLKYLIIGGVALAVLLYGLSFVYGMTAQTNLHQIFTAMQGYKPNLILGIASIFIISGLCFKISAIPFYNWAPDVYQCAPLPIAAYLSVVSKIAGFVILTKVLFAILFKSPFLNIILAIIAILTMTIGNLAAIKQENIKRLMAYSSIAQAGYILTGISLLSTTGISAVAYYLMIYFFMNFGAWAAIEIFEENTQKTNISDYTGIAYTNPTFASFFSVCLVSLAGIPITVGFFGKFYLFMNLAISNRLYLILLLIALLNTLIAVYYYLKVIKVMFDSNKEVKSENALNLLSTKTLYSNTILFLSSVATIILGFLSSNAIEFFQYITLGIIK